MTSTPISTDAPAQRDSRGGLRTRLAGLVPALLALAFTLVLAASARAAISPAIKVFKPTPAPAPTGVKFDAGATTNNEGYDNWEDLVYLWDFGDGSAPALSWGVRAGQSSNTQCCTWNAGHVYTAPGTYTVTLIVRSPRGTEAQTTTTVTIDSDAAAGWVGANVVCISNDADLSWCPDRGVGHTVRTNVSGDVKSVIDDYTNGPRKILLECGARYAWSGGAITNFVDGPGLISCAGGTGNKAVIDATGSGIAMWNTSDAGDNWRITNMNFESGGSDYTGQIFGGSGTDINDLTFYNLEFDGMGTVWRSDANPSSRKPINVAFVKWNSHSNSTPTYGMWAYFNDSFVQDFRMWDLNYHSIRTHFLDRSIISDGDFNSSGDDQATIKFSGSDPSGEHSDHDTVSWNNFYKDGVQHGQLSINPQAASGYNEITEFTIVESNACIVTVGSSSTCFNLGGRDIVARNNACIGLGATSTYCVELRGGSNLPDCPTCGQRLKVLNTTCYSLTATGQSECVHWSNAPAPTVKNTLTWCDTCSNAIPFNDGAGTGEVTCGNVGDTGSVSPFAVGKTIRGYPDLALGSGDTVAKGRGCTSDEAVIDGARGVRPTTSVWDSGAFEAGAPIWSRTGEEAALRPPMLLNPAP